MSSRRHEEHDALGIVLAALHPAPPAELVETARRRAPAAWERAAATVLRVHQEPLFHEFLERHVPDAPLAESWRQQISAQRLLHAFRWEELRECLADVVVTLARAGIRPILLKGAAFVGDLYVPARLRPMRDIDLLVEETEVARADQALAEAGYRPSEEAELYVGHHHLPPRFHPDSGVCVEVHRSPLSDDARLPGVPALEVIREGLRDSRALAPDELRAGGSSPALPAVLEPTLSLLVTCLHFTHGEHIGGRVGQLVDVARLLAYRAGEIDWERVHDWSRERALAASLATTIGYLAEHAFPGVPSGELHRLFRAAGLRPWERRLLGALLERYRFGTPAPWRPISPRVGNILWHETIRRAPAVTRAATALNRVFSRGKKSWRARQSQRAENVAAGSGC